MQDTYNVRFKVEVVFEIIVGARDEDEAYDRALEILREGGEYDLIEIGDVVDSEIEEI
jgi:hypothetical protein